MFANKKWLLIILILLINSTVFSQYRRSGRSTFSEGLSITAKGGVNMFYGDLVDQSRNSYSLGLSLDREFNKLISTRVQLVGGQMKGGQIYGDTDLEYANFKNYYGELTIGGTYRPLNHIMGYFRERFFQPYALVQLGLIYYSTTEYYGPGWEYAGYPVDPLSNIWREASGIAPIVGIGGGASFWISPRIRANLEIYGIYCFSDKIDGHDTWFEYPSGKVHITASNDFYYIATLGITYTINDSKFRNEYKYNRQTYSKNKDYFQKKLKKSSTYN